MQEIRSLTQSTALYDLFSEHQVPYIMIHVSVQRSNVSVITGHPSRKAPLLLGCCHLLLSSKP